MTAEPPIRKAARYIEFASHRYDCSLSQCPSIDECNCGLKEAKALLLNPTPDRSLIEKLEHEATFMDKAGKAAIWRAIAIVRQHQADRLVSGTNAEHKAERPKDVVGRLAEMMQSAFRQSKFRRLGEDIPNDVALILAEAAIAAMGDGRSFDQTTVSSASGNQSEMPVKECKHCRALRESEGKWICPVCGKEFVAGQLWHELPAGDAADRKAAGACVASATIADSPAPATDQPDTCRKAFEEWARARFLETATYTHSWTKQTKYAGTHVDAMWQGWQAAWDARPSEREGNYPEFPGSSTKRESGTLTDKERLAAVRHMAVSVCEQENAKGIAGKCSTIEVCDMALAALLERFELKRRS